MGRKHRTITEGTIYHIIQRGNNRKYIYEDPIDKRSFLQLLVDAAVKYEFKILYYVLMDNHYHLILESSEIPIWKGIQNLNVRYSKYFNKKYNRTGTIYEGRYSGQVISSTKYFYQVVKYLARNPVKAGIVKSPDDYLWSAHKEIQLDRNGVVDRSHFLSYFQCTEQRALRTYLDLIKDAGDFRLYYNSRLENAGKPDQLFNYILNSLDLAKETISRLQSGDKGKDILKEREQFINACHKAGISITDIADYLSYSHEGVRRIIKKHCEAQGVKS